MKNLTRQNPRQLIVAQELINKVKSKCCGIKAIDKQQEQIDNISAFVDEQLEELQRSIFHLRFDEDLTIAEIARRLGLNPNTAYKYLAQSIQKIRNHFKR